MGYVINIVKFGFNHECGLFCGKYRYIAPAQQIPVTTNNSFQKPKIYKTFNNANKTLEKLKLKFNKNGEHLIGIVQKDLDITNKERTIMSKEINKETLEKLQEIADYKNVDLDRLIKAFNYLKDNSNNEVKDIIIVDKLEIQTNLILCGTQERYEGE